MLKFISEEQAFLPVPAYFIKRFMCGAPSDYVKVYLYGLYLAHSGISMEQTEMEEALHLSGAQIISALDYWRDKGLISQLGNAYVWLAETNQEKPEHEYGPPELYPKKEYNAALNELFGRPLSMTDLKKIYDYTDVFKLPEEVVLFMIGHIVELKGASISIQYLDKVAQTWSEKGIFTIELAKENVELREASSSGVKEVMRRMGIIGKTPGKTELDYYTKWMTEWKFSHGAILAAMDGKEFASASRPFKYLDEILRNLYEKGAVSSQDVAESTAADEELRGAVKQILTALEYSKKNVAPRYIQYYENWRDSGYAMEIILLACSQTAKSGYKKFKDVDSLLKEWDKLKLDGISEIQAHIESQDRVGLMAAQVYERAGIRRSIGETDRKFYTEYTKTHGMSHDVLMYAAEISSVHANEPFPYMKKLLSNWQKKGLTTLQDVKNEDLGRFTGAGGPKKDVYRRPLLQDDGERMKNSMLKALKDED